MEALIGLDKDTVKEILTKRYPHMDIDTRRYGDGGEDIFVENTIIVEYDTDNKVVDVDIQGEPGTNNAFENEEETVEVYVLDRKTGERQYENPIRVYTNALNSGQRRVARVGYRECISLDKYELVRADTLTDLPPVKAKRMVTFEDNLPKKSGHVIIGPKDPKINMRTFT